MTTQDFLDHKSSTTGSQTFFRYPLMKGYIFTEGVEVLAKNANCFWYLDKIFTNQLRPAIRAEEFQVWQMIFNSKGQWWVTCEDGNGHQVFRERIADTDFPLELAGPPSTVWLENQTAMLPEER